MNWDSYLATQRERIAAKLAKRTPHTDAINVIRDRCSRANCDPSNTEAAAVNVARAALAEIDLEVVLMRERLAADEAEHLRDEAAIRLSLESYPTAGVPPVTGRSTGNGNAMRAYDQVGRVTGEARTYSALTAQAEERSFFADLYAAEALNDYAAKDRLTRHAHEAVVEGEMGARAISTGGLAGLVPPQYMIEDAAAALRSGRPFANVIKKMQIPDTGMVLTIPRGTTGASVAVQATENTVVSNTDEVWTNINLQVATVAGYSAVSRQSLQRAAPGIDQIIFADMAGAYGAAVDNQMFSGTGATGQVLGLLNTAGIGAATAYGAVITAQLFTSKLAGRIAAIAGAGAIVKPRYIVMNPRRWAWYSTLMDTTGRPLVSTVGAGPNNASAINSDPGGYGGDGNDNASGANVVGYLQGLPVITSINAPSAVGTNSEDQVIICDTEQAMLFEDGDGSPTTLTFEQTQSTQLTVNLVSYGYIAATFGRYPGANQTIGGLDSTATFGQVAPTF